MACVRGYNYERIKKVERDCKEKENCVGCPCEDCISADCGLDCDYLYDDE